LDFDVLGHPSNTWRQSAGESGNEKAAAVACGMPSEEELKATKLPGSDIGMRNRSTEGDRIIIGRNWIRCDFALAVLCD